MTFPLWFGGSSLDDTRRDAESGSRPRLVRSGGDSHALPAALENEDQGLVRALAAEDVNVAGVALEAIFRAWYAPLIAFARILVGDESGAQDIVQEVFIDIWRRRAMLTLSSSLAAYLHSAVRHRAFARRRDDANRQRILGTIAASEYLEAAGGASSTLEGEHEDEDEQDRRFRAVIMAADMLPPRAREVFYLRWRQGLSYQEIASVMGIARKTVEGQMTIAMRRIRKEMQAF